jgi:hypothetical protein
MILPRKWSTYHVVLANEWDFVEDVLLELGTVVYISIRAPSAVLAGLD